MCSTAMSERYTENPHTCPHNKETYLVDLVENSYTGEIEERGEWDLISTTVDVGIHHYKCYQCGKIFEY